MQTITLVQKNEVKGDGDGMEKNKEAARSKWGSICIGIGDALGDYIHSWKNTNSNTTQKIHSNKSLHRFKMQYNRTKIM